MRRKLRQALPLLLAILVVASAYAFLHIRLGTGPFEHSAYDSYTLQALAWREGRVSLGQDYPYLELAVFEGDWYVSFPPVPSIPQWLLTFFFGSQTPDGLLIKCYALAAMVILYHCLRKRMQWKPWQAALFSGLFAFGGPLLTITLNGGVWFQAQALNFLLLVAAFSAMAFQRPTLCCILYALSVGCRPFSVLFGPALLLMYLEIPRNKRPRLYPGILAGLAIAGCYAAYNYARFGNPLEFGHNYLPEFTRIETGQFSFSYLLKNVRQFFFGLPIQNGQWQLFGFSMFLSNLPLTLLVILFLWDLLCGRLTLRKLAVFCLMAAQLFFLLLHKSFGGLQFGARYTLELTPYLLVWLYLEKRRGPVLWENVLLGAGAAFNIWGAYLLNSNL